MNNPFVNLNNDENFNGELLCNEPLSAHTTYKIGGKAKYFANVYDVESLIYLLELCKKSNMPWFVFGGGSNLLISDDGYDGLIVTLAGRFKDFNDDQNAKQIYAGSAVSLSRVVNECKRYLYSGFEFAAGIPGTLGGAIKMNAGSKTEWIAKQIVSVDLLDANLNIVNKNADDIDWAYRHSSINNDEIILGACLKYEVCRGDAKCQELLASYKDFAIKKRTLQPLDKPSCGSVFKNPDGASAGKLIDEVGLKGTQIGGAQISNSHANFIVNTGDAKAKDVLDLIKLAKTKVYEKFNIKLELEVKLLGFNEEEILF